MWLEMPVGEDGAQLGDFIHDEDAVDPVRVTAEPDIAHLAIRSVICRLDDLFQCVDECFDLAVVIEAVEGRS